MITVVNYGIGNVGSILNMLRYLGIPAEARTEPEAILAAEKLILPGVGAFDHAIAQIDSSGLRSSLDEAVLRRKVPVLGICLGMQLLAQGSEEGMLPGLGWISGQSRRFDLGNNPEGLRVPLMGWADIAPKGRAHLFAPQGESERFYFVHSYHLVCANEADIAATARHGSIFTAAIEHDHIFGVQFHPEKSHRFGMALFQRFADLEAE